MTFRYEAEVEVSEEQLEGMIALTKKYYAQKGEEETLCDCVWRACYAFARGWPAYDYIALSLEDEVTRRITEENETVS